MKSSGRCPKCGSTNIIPRVRMIDRGDHNSTNDLQATLQAKTDALLFKEEVKFTLGAWICSKCGYTELYSTHAE